MSSLWISVNRCENKPHCKSREEIDDYLDSVQLTILTNDQIYSASQYSDSTITKTLKKTYIPIDWRERPHLKVQELIKSSIESQESLVELGFTEN